MELSRPLVMGILNVTPDSFSDGGEYMTASSALEHAAEMIAEGADIVDVGGESTRPQYAKPVSAAEEQRRVLPVIEELRTRFPDVVISIDTVKASTAQAALNAGAQVVNDVSGMRLDDGMARVCADTGAGVVVMHSRGNVADMATYEHARFPAGLIADVYGELRRAVARAEAEGIAPERIAVDPGIGFGKRAEQSLLLLSTLRDLAAWGYPVLVGASRKRFIGEITGVERAADRVYGSVGAACAAYARGAHIFRVHDVRATRQALDVMHAIERTPT